MAFPQSFLDELNERADIADVVSDYVVLRQRGANMFGICPFHSEKTPSFSINRDKQIFHCFGCGVGGGAITFIKMIENLDFPDAVRFLASRLNMTVPEDDGGDTSRRRTKMLELNKAVARFYHETLMGESADAAAAREYFERRGLSMKTVRRFGLGFAPNEWNSLTQNIKGFDQMEMLDAGLLVRNKKGGYDRFRNRVIFPIIDVRGNVVAFGGRVMDDSTPKYLNSSETLVFSKSRHLFAMNIAKKSKRPQIILAEGYMDVIALHQAGFDNAVASLGTSLTDAQARLIVHYKPKAVIAYDMDNAGRSAAERAISLLEAAGVEVKLLNLSGAKDPDEFVKLYGADALSNRLDRSEGHAEYRLAQIRAKHDIEDDEGRVAFVREGAALVAALENGVERAIYAARVAQEGGVDKTVVEREAESVRKANSKKVKQRERRAVLQPSVNLQPSGRGIRYDNVKSAAAEEAIVYYCYSDPELLAYAAERLTAEEFSASVLGHAFAELRRRSGENRAGPPGMMMFEAVMEQEEVRHIGRVLNKEMPSVCDTERLQAYIDTVKEQLKLSGDLDLTELWKIHKQKKGLESEEL